MKYKFESMFEMEPDGYLTPIYPIRIGAVEIGAGIRLPPGLNIAGVAFGDFIEDEVEADFQDGVFILRLHPDEDRPGP